MRAGKVTLSMPNRYVQYVRFNAKEIPVVSLPLKWAAPLALGHLWFMPISLLPCCNWVMNKCACSLCVSIYIYIDVFPGFPKTTFLNQWPTEYFRYLYISYLAASFWVSIGIINSTWSLFWVLLQDIELSSLRHPSYILLGA